MMRFKIALAAVAAAFCLQPGPAGAEDLPIGTAHAKNLVERTVTIDDQTYRVDGTTRILDVEGRPMALEQVKTADQFQGLVPLDDVTYAYDAHGSRLAELRAVELPR